METQKKRGGFTGSLGFILAAAGSAVGLGNIWRFPYLAAKDGGGLFLLAYVVLALTFGFTLLTTEIAIGRKTGQSPLTAYGELAKKWKWIGVFACIIPTMILPYYSAIGGWVLKYMGDYFLGGIAAGDADSHFGAFITAQWSPIVWFLIFLAATVFVVWKGVDKGIEKLSTILMPALLLLIVGISIFSLTLSHTDDAGVTRTGLEGFLVYIVPNLEGMTFKDVFVVLMDAMGQLFYSISVAMGIMVAYGSYVKKDVDIIKSVNRIEIFDSVVAFLAGLMIIPAVYTFMGREGLAASGPTLMFKSMPKVFDAMGGIGTVLGIAFFVMVAFAALTSSVSIMEAIVASLMDQFKISRNKGVVLVTLITLVLGTVVCLGYNVFYFELPLPNGSVAQVLDIMDYISNYILMPVVSIATCILIGWVVGPKTILDEVTLNGEKTCRKGLYIVMIKYITPVLLLLMLLQALGLFLK